MTLFPNRRPKPRARRSMLYLEPLESRALPTVFSLGQVPAAYALEQATESVRVTRDQGPVADVSVSAVATPVGMGYQSGYFNVNGNDAIRIDTAPGPCQALGDRVKVAFAYTWTAGLQTYQGTDPPWETFINVSTRLTAGTLDEDLFRDFISSTFTYAERDGSQDRFVIPMRVGDSVQVSLTLDGEAHAAQPHYQTWVDFQAEFTVQDAGTGGARSACGDTAVPTSAVSPHAADAVFALRGAALARPGRGSDPAAFPPTTGPAEAAVPRRTPTPSVSASVRHADAPGELREGQQGQTSDRPTLPASDEDLATGALECGDLSPLWAGVPKRE